MAGARRKIGVGVGIALTAGAVIFGVREQAPQLARIPRSAVHEDASTRVVSYQAVPASKVGWGQPRGLRPTIRRMRHRLRHHSQTGYTIRYQGHTSVRRNLKLTMERMRELAPHLPYSDVASPRRSVIIVKAEQDGYRDLLRKFDKDPTKIVNTEGTHAIDTVIGTTLWRFPTVRILGIYVCRNTVYGGISQHAFGNAVDLGGSTSLLDQVARYQYGLARAGWLPLAQLIWRGREWFSGHGVYDHYNHIHDSGRPLMSGGCRRAAFPVRVPGAPTGATSPSTVTSAPLEGPEF